MNQTKVNLWVLFLVYKCMEVSFLSAICAAQEKGLFQERESDRNVHLNFLLTAGLELTNTFFFFFYLYLLLLVIKFFLFFSFIDLRKHDQISIQEKGFLVLLIKMEIHIHTYIYCVYIYFS